MPRTIGVSRKLLAPVVIALTAALTTFIVSGEFDRTELALVASAAIGALFGYLLPADPVDDPNALGEVGPSSDDLLGATLEAGDGEAPSLPPAGT